MVLLFIDSLQASWCFSLEISEGKLVLFVSNSGRQAGALSWRFVAIGCLSLVKGGYSLPC